jgi:hypothetical protein
MSVILLMLGIVVAAAGIATIGFGIPINEFSLGTTLIIAGTTALTGGLVLIGLSAVVTELGRVAEGLKNRTTTRPAAAAKVAEAQEPALQPINQPMIQPPAPMPAPAAMPPPLAPSPAAVAASMRPPPQQQPTMTPRPAPELPVAQARPPEHYPAANPSAVEVSAAAIERLRSSIPRTERPRAEPSEIADYEEVPLSPNGAAHRAAQPRAPAAEQPPPEPRVAAEDRGGAAVEALRASRLDFLFRSKPDAARAAPQPPQAAPQSENFDAFWPADGRTGRPATAPGSEPAPRAEQVERRADYGQQPAAAPPQTHAQPPRREAAPADEVQAPTILKSGVVDGMAYTLYSDGSIEAKLPHGTVRFGSIAELRAHIESNS